MSGAKPYVYRGTKREGLPDLETANKKIMAARTTEQHGPGQGPRLGTADLDDACRKGHKRTEASTAIRADGTRRCRICDQRRNCGRPGRAAA